MLDEARITKVDICRHWGGIGISDLHVKSGMACLNALFSVC